MARRGFLRWLPLVLLASTSLGVGIRSGEPPGGESVWIAVTGGTYKVSDPGGDFLLTLGEAQEVRAVAVDAQRATVWSWAGRMLRAYGFQGEPRLAISLPLPDADDAELAVCPEDGSVWLAVGDELQSVSAAGQALQAFQAGGRVEALTVSGDLLWVATRRSVSAHDAVTGALVRTLLNDPSSGLRGLDAGRQDEVWVAGTGGLRRYSDEGDLGLSVPLAGFLSVAALPGGEAWTASAKELVLVGPAGERRLSVRPFGGRGVISGLAADPVDRGVWVANEGELARVSASGTVTRASGLPSPVHIRDLALYSDTFPPEIEIRAPLPGSLANHRLPSVEVAFQDIGTGIDPGSLDVRMDGTVLACQVGETKAICALQAPLADGEHAVTAVVRDLAGNLSQPASLRFTVDATPPVIRLDRPASGLVTGDREQVFEGSVSEPAALTLNGAPVELQGLAFRHGPILLEEGDNAFLLKATDSAGNTSELSLTVTLRTAPPDPLPSDPSKVAPPVDPTVASDLSVDTAFLYTGENPIQTGVAPGTIEPRRAAVVRGRVISREGAPLSGARVSILGRPELGSTLSRADGMYDLAVNGGGVLVVQVEKDGRLPAQRPVDVPWHDFTWVPEVALVPYDTAATVIASGSAEIQVARGSEVQDEDGTRRPTLLFPAGTRADMILPDGTVQPLPSLTVRATEYTVGPNGPKAMPGPLVEPVGYTYAVELSVDEASTAGAKQVRFDQSVVHYVENFLGFPVGSAVPAASWDRERTSWIPSENGRVVRVLGTAGGLAELDVDGSGSPAEAPVLAALGITPDELRQLALLYVPGKSLWRVPLQHFSAVDLNWNLNGSPDPLEESQPPEVPEPETDEPEEDTCEQAGSIIECQNQVLGEEVPVAGTPFRLHYRSDRVPGRIDNRNLTVRLSGAELPPGLKRIDLDIRLAGQRFIQSFTPAPNLSFTYKWDGRDAYGRSVQGRVAAMVDLGYVYESYYQAAGARFGQTSPGWLERFKAREDVTLWRSGHAFLGTWNAQEQGLGGWSLTVHHAYEPGGRIVHFGDGSRLSRRSLGLIQQRAAGLAGGSRADGGPAIQAVIFQIGGLEAAADGGFLYADRTRVRRVDPVGIVRTVAGGEIGGYAGDGGPATAAKLNQIGGLAFGPDGSFYIADTWNDCIRVVDPRGVIRTLAGRGNLESSGIPGSQARLYHPSFLVMAPDGSLYFSESEMHRVRRLTPDGLLWTVAGTGEAGFSGDGGPASAAHLNAPTNLAVDAGGNLYISDWFNGRIRRVRTHGAIETVLGGGRSSFFDGILGTDLINVGVRGMRSAPDGSLVFAASDQTYKILRMSPEGTVASIDDISPSGASQLRDLALGPKGDILMGYWTAVARGLPLLPEAGSASFSIPSRDGSELHIFDSRGRHLRTMDALTGALRYQFTYDSAGLLSRISDASGNVTRIERHTNGNPAAIVSPDGHRTTLAVDAAGYLTRIENPRGEAFSYTSSPEGLLLSQTDPRGGLSGFLYDEGGRLIRDTNAAGGFKSLSRTARPEGYQVDVTTSLGRRTSYAVDRPDSGEVRTETLPSGEVFRTSSSLGGSHWTQAPDGTSITVLEGEDPRFGSLAPYAAGVSVRVPSGLTSTTTRIRDVRLAVASDPLSVTSVSEFVFQNDLASSATYSAAQRRLTLESAQRRQRLFNLDDKGRLISASVAGLEPVALTYDARGRLASVSQGTGESQRAFQFAYGADGRLASMTDPLSRTVALEYDEAGRVIRQVQPDGAEILLSYDASGNLTAVVPPERPAHAFAWTSIDLLQEYAPPATGGEEVRTRYEHDADGALDRILRPDGRAVRFDRDTAGRLTGLETSRGRLTYDYLTTGQLGGIATPEGEALRFNYDGFLPTRATWTGPVSGRVDFGYDNDFRVASLTVGSTPAVTFGYDNDSLLVQAGALTLTQDTRNGLLTATAADRVTTAQTYNGFGEPATFEARVSGAPVLSLRYTRDRLGRIVQKEETLEGATETLAYTYDLAGRLTRVDRDGVILSRYEYDRNGNRRFRETPGGTVTADYDAQDRLLRNGDTAFTYTANGELASRTQGGQTVTYEYDELGNLGGVTLADGIRIDYVMDGRSRRVGKRVNGALVQGFLYKDQLEPVAELDGAGAVKAVFVYGSRPHVPDLMLKGGRTYRIIADHLGSPRLVIDTGTGAVLQRMDYDEYGKVILDTNPRFQPFGFAGGLYDPQTGLVRFGARDYDPEIGRWTAKDPIGFGGGDSNIYGYVESNPVNLIDSTGFDAYNSCHCTIYVKPENSPKPEGEAIPLAPGKTYKGLVDGIAHPQRPGVVFKVPDGTDIIAFDNGGAMGIPTNVVSGATEFLEGWKGEDFLKDRHGQKTPDHNWDALFNASRGEQSGQCPLEGK